MIVFVLGVLFSIAFLVTVVDMMRRRVLLEQYSLFWLSMGVVMLFLAIFPGVLIQLAHVMGIINPPSLLFLIGFLFLIGTMLHLTVVLSKLNTRTVRLVQEIGILRAEVAARDRVIAGTALTNINKGEVLHDDNATEVAGSHSESIPTAGL